MENNYIFYRIRILMKSIQFSHVLYIEVFMINLFRSRVCFPLNLLLNHRRMDYLRN